MARRDGTQRSGSQPYGSVPALIILLLLSLHAGLHAQGSHRRPSGTLSPDPSGEQGRDRTREAGGSIRGRNGPSGRRAPHSRFGSAEAVALLKRGYRAERVAVYSGVKVIRAPDRCRNSSAGQPVPRDTMGGHVCSDYERSVRIWHGGPALTRLEFVAPDGDGSGATPGAPVVVENGRRRWFYSPRHRTWRPISWHPPEPRLDLLLKNYHILPGAVDRVAGRLALQVRIEPRHPGNPRKQSWLDLATGIALRSDLYDHRGNLVSTAAFRHFRTEPSLPPALFQAPGAGVCAPDEGASHTRRAFSAAFPSYLPRGYVLDRVSRSRQGGTEVVRARFTDGLNVLSLVEWKGRRDPEDRGSERFWAPGERVRRQIGPISVLLAGDLSGDELRRISASIRPEQRGTSARLSHK